MKTVYHAANLIEAHIVSGMLAAHDIAAHVGGHYLQGGVGDLAPMDIATVSVADEAVDAAMELIRAYQAAG